MYQSQLPHSDQQPAGVNTAKESVDTGLRMYWGVASGSTRKAIRLSHSDETVRDHGQAVDLSEYPEAEHAFLSFETRNNIPFEGPDWGIDCGGFSALDNSDRYEYDTPIEEYIDFLLKHIDRGVSIKHWALRDWPYSEEYLSATGRDMRDHLRWTVRDHINCLQVADRKGLLSRTGVEPLPVLQGETYEDYIWHIDYLRDHGLLVSDTVCIGSLVSRPIDEIQLIIGRVRDALPSKYSLHGLGVKYESLKNPDAVEILDSVDTTSWNYEAKRRDGEGPHTENWIDLLDAYTAYRSRLEHLYETQPEGTQSVTKGLYEFLEDPQSVTGNSGFEMVECICGRMIGGNAITDDDTPTSTGEGCRHCRLLVSRLSMASRGEYCDLRGNDPQCHPLCSVDHTQSPND